MGLADRLKAIQAQDDAKTLRPPKLEIPMPRASAEAYDAAERAMRGDFSMMREDWKLNSASEGVSGGISGREGVSGSETSRLAPTSVPSLPVDIAPTRRAFAKRGSVVEYARQVTSDGKALAAMLWDIAQGNPVCMGYRMDVVGRAVRDAEGQPIWIWEWPNLKYRLQAIESLADRGLWPRQQVVHQTHTHVHYALNGLSLEELRALDTLHTKIGAERIVEGEVAEDQPHRPVRSEDNANDSNIIDAETVPGDVVGT
jgi:hypothetical protein